MPKRLKYYGEGIDDRARPYRVEVLEEDFVGTAVERRLMGDGYVIETEGPDPKLAYKTILPTEAMGYFWDPNRVIDDEIADATMGSHGLRVIVIEDPTLRPIINVDQPNRRFEVDGNATGIYEVGDQFRITGSDGNDKLYTVTGTTILISPTRTRIEVSESIPSATISGSATSPYIPYFDGPVIPGQDRRPDEPIEFPDTAIVSARCGLADLDKEPFVNDDESLVETDLSIKDAISLCLRRVTTLPYYTAVSIFTSKLEAGQNPLEEYYLSAATFVTREGYPVACETILLEALKICHAQVRQSEGAFHIIERRLLFADTPYTRFRYENDGTPAGSELHDPVIATTEAQADEFRLKTDRQPQTLGLKAVSVTFDHGELPSLVRNGGFGLERLRMLYGRDPEERRDRSREIGGFRPGIGRGFLGRFTPRTPSETQAIFWRYHNGTVSTDLVDAGLLKTFAPEEGMNSVYLEAPDRFAPLQDPFEKAKNRYVFQTNGHIIVGGAGRHLVTRVSAYPDIDTHKYSNYLESRVPVYYRFVLVDVNNPTNKRWIDESGAFVQTETEIPMGISYNRDAEIQSIGARAEEWNVEQRSTDEIPPGTWQLQTYLYQPTQIQFGPDSMVVEGVFWSDIRADVYQEDGTRPVREVITAHDPGAEQELIQELEVLYGNTPVLGMLTSLTHSDQTAVGSLKEGPYNSYPIIDAYNVAGENYFGIENDRSAEYAVDQEFRVKESTGNNQVYTIESIVYESQNNTTYLHVNEQIPSAIIDGVITEVHTDVTIQRFLAESIFLEQAENLRHKECSYLSEIPWVAPHRILSISGTRYQIGRMTYRGARAVQAGLWIHIRRYATSPSFDSLQEEGVLTIGGDGAAGAAATRALIELSSSTFNRATQNAIAQTTQVIAPTATPDNPVTVDRVNAVINAPIETGQGFLLLDPYGEEYEIVATENRDEDDEVINFVGTDGNPIAFTVPVSFPAGIWPRNDSITSLFAQLKQSLRIKYKADSIAQLSQDVNGEVSELPVTGLRVDLVKDWDLFIIPMNPAADVLQPAQVSAATTEGSPTIPIVSAQIRASAGDYVMVDQARFSAEFYVSPFEVLTSVIRERESYKLTVLRTAINAFQSVTSLAVEALPAGTYLKSGSKVIVENRRTGYSIIATLSAIAQAPSDTISVNEITPIFPLPVGSIVRVADETYLTELKVNADGISANSSAISGNTNAIAGLDTRVSTNEASISTHASIFTNNELTAGTNITQRVTTTEASISSHATILGNNELTSSTNITQRVTTTEASISSHASIFSNNQLTSSTNITQRVTTIGARVVVSATHLGNNIYSVARLTLESGASGSIAQITGDQIELNGNTLVRGDFQVTGNAVVGGTISAANVEIAASALLITDSGIEIDTTDPVGGEVEYFDSWLIKWINKSTATDNLSIGMADLSFLEHFPGIPSQSGSRYISSHGSDFRIYGNSNILGNLGIDGSVGVTGTTYSNVFGCPEQGAAPAAVTGMVLVYAKSDGKLYFKDDTGQEYQIDATAV